MKQHHNLPAGFWCGDFCCLIIIWGHTTQQIGDYYIQYDAFWESLFTRQVSIKGQHTVLNFAQVCLLVHVKAPPFLLFR
jgi:hypothetical protein